MLDVSAIDHWLMDVVSIASVELSLVVLPESRLRVQWGDYRTPMYGWSPDVIRHRLLNLLRNGLISVADDATTELWSAVRLQAYLEKTSACPQSCPYYYLTTQGAQYWERVFTPDWDRFHRKLVRQTNVSVEFVRLECGSAALRNELLASSFVLVDRRFGLQRVKLGEFQSWRPVYWKTLSTCAYVRFACRFLPVIPTVGTLRDVRHLFRPWGRCWPSNGLSTKLELQ